MYGKLVHRPPFGHHYHAPRPPFGEPREVGERYLGHPELTDYWIKPYLLEALKHYPRLDDACVVQGLWKFANTICLQNKHTSIRTPPTYDDPVTTHKIAFLDKDDIELGCIKFWRKVDSTFGIDMILNGRGISITGNNDDPTLCLVDTPIGDNKKQIVNIEYLEFSLSALQGLVDDLTNRVTALEDYKGQADSLIRDPNGNFRTVHTAIHNDSDDQNIPTCYAVYQFGQSIRDAIPIVEDAVYSGSSNVPTQSAVYNTIHNAITSGLLTLPTASKTNKGIMQVGDYLNVSNGLVSVDVDTILQLVNGLINNSSSGGSGGSGGGSSNTTTWASVSYGWTQFYSERATNGGSYNSLRGSNTSLLGNISGVGTSYNSPKFTVSVAPDGTYADGSCVAIGDTFTCTNTDTNVSKSYTPLRLVIIYDGTRSSGGGNQPGGVYWQNVSARVWYKESNYTLTAQDISDINAAADAFAASRSLGYDSGALS